MTWKIPPIEALTPPAIFSGTEYPFYAITRRALCGRIFLAGPFLTVGEAEAELYNNRAAYGPLASVFCFSGRKSPSWRALYNAVVDRARKRT